MSLGQESDIRNDTARPHRRSARRWLLWGAAAFVVVVGVLPFRTGKERINLDDKARAALKSESFVRLSYGTHRTATISHIGNIAMILGRKLRWDPAVERFFNDDEANRMLSRPMRGPWSL